ncbi:MAG TPA: hypothetical protein DCS67_09815, partial [Clostridiales bacterium UBA8960]|nr:hypothetical protein [Clostridiales bacterium UBA8960]
MNKRRILIAILISMTLLLFGCSYTYDKLENPILPDSRPESNTMRNPEIGIQTIINEGDTQTVSVHYPSTGYIKIDNTLTEFANNRIELFNQEIANIQLHKEENLPYELHIDYDIVYETAHHISILFTESKFSGGSQSISTRYTYTFNVDQGRQLALRDLFKGSSAYLEILSQYAHKALITDRVLNISLDEEWVTKGVAPLESNFKQFLLNADGITILFDKYQLGPAFIGEPMLDIPFDVFTAHIELKEIALIPAPTESYEETSEGTSELETEPVTEVEATREKQADEPILTKPAIPKKRIAITFEDGPHPIYTELILDTLKSRKTVSTFFVIGNRALEYPEMLMRIHDEGHLIGNHSWSHPQLTRLTNENILDQISKTQDTIAEITGYTPYLYRPPYGIYNENVVTHARMPAILWSIDPKDLLYHDASYITNYVLDHAFDGAI